MNLTVSSVTLGAIVLIPIRSFDDMKSRLASVLKLDERRRLAIWMAERVVTAAEPFPTRVVTNDSEVSAWTQRTRAEVINPGVRGLNAAVTAAMVAVGAEGFDRVIIAHADLPAAQTLAAFDGDGIRIAPDCARRGSNVLSVPTASKFTFRYGPDSFEAHCTEAERLRMPIIVIDDPRLAWDVDDPADLPAEWRAIVAKELR